MPMVTYHKVTRCFDHAVFQNQVTNQNHYVPTTRDTWQDGNLP